MLNLIVDVLENGYLITSLVLVMMIMIEYINVGSSGKAFEKLLSTKQKQVIFGALLGVFPGCLGGFAAVSLYSHGMFGIGALVAAMISSSGDESFVMLAMIPKTAIILFGVLFIIAVLCGMITDLIFKNKKCSEFFMGNSVCNLKFEVHNEHSGEVPNIFRLSSYKGLKHPSSERIIILSGVLLFAVAVFSGIFEHGGHEHLSVNADFAAAVQSAGHLHSGIQNGITILNERWVNIFFACLSIVVIFFIAASSEHFIKEHIWKHIIKKHALQLFLWTTGALAVITIGLHYLDLAPWLHKNVYILLLLAALIGMIPESGPNMIFITLFAGGLIPFSVLLTSSISQDGHTALPLLASCKRSFVAAKLINALFAIAFGSIFYLLGF